MSTEDTAAPPEVTPETRKLQMLDLWGATVQHLLDRLQGDEADKLTASFMDTVVGFLRDSGINADTVTEIKDAMTDMHADLIQQIKEVTADQGEPEVPQAPVKAKAVVQAEVVPLHRPFEPRPPR